MKIVVCSSSTAFNEAGFREVNGCVQVKEVESFADHQDADAYFNLNENALSFNYPTSKPVFIHSVLETLPPASLNLYRINAWPGFLQRDAWEIAGKKDENISEIFSALGKKIIWVKDDPGFIAARVICMIINEAYFAIEDKISSREEIDTAMKLGTGYPYGPFEWAEKIGAERVGKLLQIMALSDKRYTPSVLIAIDNSHP